MRPGDRVGGRFEIRSLAGTGGMGRVYRALDRVSGAEVALKLLSNGLAHGARFRREAEILAVLDHPHVVRYVAHGDGSDGGPAYLAMEWADGVTLREQLLGQLPNLEESVALVRRVADALGAAHRLGVVHRDIKPENLILEHGRFARVKVLDFGVALAHGAPDRMTRTGTPLGTIGYMAPEQVQGESEVDARADVFALGAVLFECLVGEAPFHAAEPLAVLAKIVLDDAPSCRALRPEIPVALDRLVQAMLSRDRAGRPRDGSAVAEGLGQFDTGSSDAPQAPSRRPPSLGPDERLLHCYVVGCELGVSAERTLALDEFETHRARRAELVRSLGGHFEPLGPGGFVASFTGRDDPGAIAERSGRAALALDAPDLGLAVVAAKSSTRERLPIAQAVERALGLITQHGSSRVLLDEALAGLLSDRFVVGDRAGARVLERERAELWAGRALLGKATGCFGRLRELETLRAIAAECHDESVARACLVTGPAGIGKTRIVRELASELGRRTPFVGRGDPLWAGTPLSLLGDLLGRAFGLSLPTAADNQRALRDAVARRVPPDELDRIAAFLAEITGFPLPDEAHHELGAARLDSLLMRDQMRRAFTDLVVHLARERPLVLVLDDLHFGDRPSLQLIDAALDRASELPLLVLGVGRPELHDAFPRLWRERGVAEVRVGPLSGKAARELVASALPTADEAQVQALIERAGGNPLFLEELIRAQVEQRSTVPESVVAMVRARLDSIEADGRRVLRAASIFGLHFWRGGLAALLADEPASRIDAWLAALEARELIVATPGSRFASERQYAFCHDLLREAAHSMLTGEDRALGHKLAAAWLETVGERDARLLAEHHERGGSRESAVPWWERAAAAALEANDFLTARAFVDRGRQAGAQGERLGALLLTEAEALRWGGELELALNSLDAGLDRVAAGSLRWCHGLADRALLAQRLGRPDELTAIGRTLLARSVRDDPSDALTFALVRAAIFCLLGGQGELARQLGDAAKQAERTGVALAAPTQAQRHVLAALTALYRGDYAAYLREELAARDWFERAGDARRALNEAGSIGFAQLELGQYAEAEATLETALARAEALGLPHLKAASWHNLGLVYARRGRVDDALRVERMALEVFRAESDRRLEGAALTYLAEIAHLAGDPAEAERWAREALAVVTRVAPPIEPLARGILAAALVARGANDEALDHAERAMRSVGEGSAETGEALIRLAHADALAACGRPVEAESALWAAQQSLLARSHKIEDPAARRRFVEDVPEHAKTMALGKRARRDFG